MLQSELIRFLTEAGPAETCIGAIPVVKVRSKPDEVISGKLSDGREDVIEEIMSPFSFTPQRIRFDKDHEFFEDGDIQRHLYLQDVATSVSDVTQTPTVSEFGCHIAGCSQVFDTLESYEHHYNSLHRHVCSECKRSFPSAHLLDIHIQERHDALFQIMAETQNMYQCLVEGCIFKFKSSKERKDHLIKTHRYPPDFRFDRVKKNKSRSSGGAHQQSDMNMELGGASGAGEAMEVECDQAKKPTERPKPSYTYKVPASVCFGQGSVPWFRRGKRGKKQTKL